MTSEQAPCEQWVWTELLAFDVEQPDFGVAQYVRTLGFVPGVLSLMISPPDVILQHDGLEQDAALPADYCARNGQEGNEIRRRQSWTRFELRDLIAALHDAGSHVYLSCFTGGLGDKFHREWMTDHPQGKLVTASRGRVTALFVLARLEDGSYLQDYFAAQLVRVCEDYGFDGWHGADGYGPISAPLYEADCSDDMIEQFIASGRHDLPEVVTRPSHDLPENLQPRMDWIWRHRRIEWITFWTDRWAQFWRTMVDALHGIGRKAVINSAWTRGPFEAMYRFGVDYRKIVDAGVDGIVVETVAGASTLQHGDRDFFHDDLAMLLLIKAYVPQARLIFLHSIKDVYEDWDLIHHAPAMVERQTYELSHVYHTGDRGQLVRCVDGFLACLADGVSSEEWRWLDRQWKLAFDAMPRSTVGATLVWSDAALHGHLAWFPAERRWSAHRLLDRLMQHNAPIQTSVRVGAVSDASGVLLVPNPHLFPADERERLFVSGQPLIAIGPGFDDWPDTFTIEFTDGPEPDAMACRLYHARADLPSAAIDVAHSANEPAPSNPWDWAEPNHFTTELEFRPVSNAFLDRCAQLIRKVSGSCSVQPAGAHTRCREVPSVSVMMSEIEPGSYRLAVKNNGPVYGKPRVDLGRPIQSVSVRSAFPVTRINPAGSALSVPVPPRGIVVVDVHTHG